MTAKIPFVFMTSIAIMRYESLFDVDFNDIMVVELHYENDFLILRI